MEKPKRRPRKKTKLILVDEPILSEENVELLSNDDFDKINLDDKPSDSNSFVNKKEILNRNFISNNEDKFENLYPSLDDSDFNIKIALKKEPSLLDRIPWMKWYRDYTGYPLSIAIGAYDGRVSSNLTDDHLSIMFTQF